MQRRPSYWYGVTRPALRRRGLPIGRRSRRYSFEEKPSKLDAKSQKAFQANPNAWEFFRTQAPWYQRTSISGSWMLKGRRPAPDD
jgi:hypothetical protein